MLHLKSILTATLGVLLAATLPAVAQSNSQDSIPAAVQEEISQICLPVQFRDGAGAYRNCVQSELDLRANGGITDLGQLSFDDKYAVQQACAKAGDQSSENYQSCVSTQISELNQIAEPALTQLSEDEIYVVQQSCFTAQTQDGAAIYRQCLNDELQSLSDIPAADTRDLSIVNKNALQLRCASSSSNVVQYRRCIADQYESIAGTEPRFLPAGTSTGVSDQPVATVNTPVENNAAENNAAENKAVEQNTNPELAIAQVTEASVDESPEVESSTTESPATTEPALALPVNNTPPTASVAGNELSNDSVPTNESISDATLNQSAATDTLATVSNAAENSLNANALPELTQEGANTQNAQNSLLANDARVISRPDLVQTLEVQAQTNATGTEPKTIGGTDSSDTSVSVSLSQNEKPLQKIRDLWQKLIDSLSTMDAIGWLLIAAVLALPAILLGLFSMARGIRKPAPATPEYAAVPYNRVDPDFQSRKMRYERDAETLFDDDMDSDHDAVTRIASKDEMDFDHDAVTRIASKDEMDFDHDAVTRIASKSEYKRVARPQQDSSNYGSVETGIPHQSYDYHTDANGASTRQSTYGDRPRLSAFGEWLLQQSEEKRMEACIEFLIYWIAYGDDRYQPHLKQRLFSTSDLSTHDQIKRWVLEQDVFAFADAVSWLRTNATQKQLDQCIGLLMALLITEYSITPVQNTVLRFLADAFNIGKNQLEQRFDKAFGHAMPRLPRTDKYAWWSNQQPELMQRWEARFMATRPENEQMMARLGLTASYDESEVITAFRRASRRCHPDRFTELGDRERALAEKQFIKFEQARDKLLGVSV